MQPDHLTESADHDEAAMRREEDLDQPTTGVQRLVYSCPVDHSGTAVYVKGWYRSDLATTPILFVHDVGEHFGRYRDAATTLCQRGHNTYGFDLRGHGRSGRRAGHIPKFSYLIKDLLQVCAWVRNREKGRAPMIVGQGVGALIVLNFHKYYAKHCAGIVLGAPSLCLIEAPTRFRTWMLRVLAESSPTLRLPNFLRPRITDAAFHSLPGRATDDDAGTDLTHKITARYAHEVLQAIDRGLDHLKAFNGKALLLIPEQDTLCRYDSILQSSSQVKKPGMIQVDIVANAGHQLFSGNDPGRSTAIDFLLSWIEKQSNDLGAQ